MENPSTETPSREPVEAPLFKKRNNKSKSKFRKRPATPPPAADSDSSAYSSSEDDSGHRIKRRKKLTSTITATSSTAGPKTSDDLTATKYAAARSAIIASSNDATKSSNWYDESDLSIKSLLGSTRSAPATSTPALPDGTYKGLANQTTFIQKNPDAPNRSIGPIKAPTNIRTITVTDFAPDVCKDYKQTGFCGFGDSCKFLHAREDYKQGWQLDKEWENVTKGKKVTGGTKISSRGYGEGDGEDDDDDEAMLENIPFACIICRERYKEPIVTKCGHYFCEGCALKRYRKDPSCAACGSGTGGVFNVAKGLKKLLDRKRERARKKREEAIAAGEEVSEDEEEGL